MKNWKKFELNIILIFKVLSMNKTVKVILEIIKLVVTALLGAYGATEIF